MKRINTSEMRIVEGGWWQCLRCKRKFVLWISMWSPAHNCVFRGFKYKWI